MSKIQILGETIANQIAAGEVVERPSSVIKELLENSLDAGADQIDLLIEDGGLSRIILSDNGEGMSAEDAVLCFARHATSKIRHAKDLESIGTFGFRGEALAAIASVSKVTLVTRRLQDETSTQVIVEGGHIKHIGPVAGNFGTRIEINDLFFNTPARLKFLRTQKSEAGAVDEIIRNVSIAQHGVGFAFRNQAQSKIDVVKVDKLLPLHDPRRMDRAISLMGEECRGHLFSIDSDMGDARLVGYIASPLLSRRDTKGIRLFVNGRVIQDRALSQAVQIAYRTLLEIGRKPVCALNIEIDPHLVDVNVHPQKSEVRFQESLGIQSQIIRTLQNYLASTPWLAKTPTKNYVIKSTEYEAPSFDLNATASHKDIEFEQDFSNSGRLGWNLSAPKNQRSVEQQVPMEMAKKRFFHELKILGQVDQTFLVLDDGNSLVLVDQHAAHERVFFEKLRKDFSENQLLGQPLLFPKQLKLIQPEIQALLEQRDFLSRFGFDVEPFGDDVAILRAIPPSLKECDAETMLKDFLAQAARNKVSTSFAEWIDRICAQMACHGSIRAGQTLSHSQIEALLVQLDEIDYNAHCPHGRPTTKVVPYTELAKWFHRL